MNAVVISVQHTSGTVAGARWLHTVSVGGEIVKVTVTPSGMGYSMEAEASSPEVAASAMGLVAQDPRGES